MRIRVIFCVFLAVFLLSAATLAGPHLQIYSGGPAFLVEQIQQEGQTVSKISYKLIKGLSWEATYTALVNEKEGTIGLFCQIRLNNLSNQEFHDATVELIAGEGPSGPRLTAEATPPPGAGKVEYGKIKIPGWTGPPPKEPSGGKSGGGYFSGPVGPVMTSPADRYFLPNPIDITKGENLIPYVKKAHLAGQLVYQFAKDSVVRLIRFQNKTGLPLPPGEVQVQRPDGTLMGEGRLDPASENEAVKLLLGAVPDLSGERTRTDYHYFIANNRCKESYRITVKSGMGKPVEVEVLEIVSGSDWKITDSSLPYKVVDDSHILFQLSVPAHGESEVTYTVEYTP